MDVTILDESIFFGFCCLSSLFLDTDELGIVPKTSLFLVDTSLSEFLGDDGGLFSSDDSGQVKNL